MLFKSPVGIVATLFMSFLILPIIQASSKIVAMLFKPFVILPHGIQASSVIVATLFMPLVILPHGIQASSKTVATLFMPFDVYLISFKPPVEESPRYSCPIYHDVPPLCSFLIVKLLIQYSRCYSSFNCSSIHLVTTHMSLQYGCSFSQVQCAVLLKITLIKCCFTPALQVTSRKQLLGGGTSSGSLYLFVLIYY